MQAAAVEITGPHWSTIDVRPDCPMCGYSLYGLREPRCPECGFRFEWGELLRPEGVEHPFLYEHHPRRGLWSFVRTQWAARHPATFWQTLHPIQPSRPGRLVGYWMISVLVYVTVMVVMLCAYRWAEFELSMRGWSPPSPVAFGGGLLPGPPATPTFDVFGYLGSGGFTDVVWWTLPSAVCWPWLTVMALGVFGISMQRARVRRIHVVRCVLYCFDVPTWLAVTSALLLGHLMISRPSPWSPDRLEGMAILALAAMAIVWAHRLSHAYRRYMRFRTPLLVAASSQVIVFLLVLVLLIQIEILRK